MPAKRLCKTMKHRLCNRFPHSTL